MELLWLIDFDFKVRRENFYKSITRSFYKKVVYKTGQVHKKVSALARESQKSLQRLIVKMNRKVTVSPLVMMRQFNGMKQPRRYRELQ